MIKKALKSKVFLVIITMILTVGTTVFATIVYNANQISYTPSDTTWNVSSVDTALNSLYDNNKSFRTNIATAITSKGVATSTTDSLQTMVDNIGSIKTGGTLNKILLTTIDYSWGGSHILNYDATGISGYQNFTKDNFILEITSVTGTGASQGQNGEYIADYTLNYDSSTGIVSTSKSMVGAVGTWKGISNVKANLYLITVQ
ncbi:MAG: hypothetical protein GX682_05410 [Clostridiaceae bacterium]|nr:hypothetical protein [Clostridiaceae bacterium]